MSYNFLLLQYAVVHVNKFRYSTPSIAKTSSPEWLSDFNVPLKGWKSTPIISIVVWAKERFRKEYLGEIEITLPELFANKVFNRDDPNNKVCA